MKARGYIAIDRGIFEHPMFLRRRKWLYAWQWLIAHAAWKPEGRRFEFGVVHVERGEHATSLRMLGTAWGWPKSNVHRFLSRLVREEMVALKSGTASGTPTGTAITILTICNYNKFQTDARKVGQQPGQQPGQPDTQPFLFAGLPGPQPANQLTKDRVAVEKSGEKGQARNSRIKPKHGAKGRGMVWFDYGSHEWELYAADFRDMHGVEKLPESREGGRGNWFVYLGEATRPRRLAVVRSNNA